MNGGLDILQLISSSQYFIFDPYIYYYKYFCFSAFRRL